jgi:hypothetical protein
MWVTADCRYLPFAGWTMPAKKGTQPKNFPRGRKRGVPNRTTRTMREILTAFVEHNAEGAQALYDKVAKHNPAKALDIFVKMAEFVLPKLNRTEVRLPSAMITNGPIASAEEASRTYAQLMGDTTIDLATITYEPMPVVAAQSAESAPVEAPLSPDNVVTLFERLSK